MIDPTKVGSLPVVKTIDANQNAKPQKQPDETGPSSAPHDEVTLSPEAVNLSQAEQTASKVRAMLEDSLHNLGLEPSFFESV